jgi:small subunit ribosomal protein S4
MSRITCKKCRRIGESLCGREKCAYKKRPYAPGKLDSDRKHKSNRSEYGLQMLQKQKVRHSYGVSEKQFSGYVKNAIANKDKTRTPAEALFQSVENRLDNVVYRSGLAHVRALARQMVVHGHITVNGKRLLSAAYQVAIGDVVSVRAGSKKSPLFAHAHDKLKNNKTVSWITMDLDKLEATVTGRAKDIEPSFDLSSVIEFYSR